jgi:hypothetical protein
MIELTVKDFSQEIKRIEEEVNVLALDNIHDRIDYATDQLRIVTPVDTGNARYGWYSIKKKTFAFGQAGEISNNVEYISILNDGHSKQAPRYFIEQVLFRADLL